MIRISVDVDDSGFAERMSAMALRAQDLRIPLTEAAEKVKTASRVNFLSQGGTSGGWSPLEPEYGAWKAANYGPLPILVRTGALAPIERWLGGFAGLGLQEVLLPDLGGDAELRVERRR